MTTKELRLGNYVNCPRDDQNPFRIDGFEFLSSHNCKVEMQWMPNFHPLTWELNDLSPIPITPEILEKCGFQYAVEIFGWVGKKHLIYQCADDGEHWWLLEPFCTDDKDLHIKIQYLHQLQNICFALEGEELIKTDLAPTYQP